MNIRFQTEEFFSKAKELGLVDDIDQQLEARKNAKRLEVLAKIKALPTREQTELPALEKALIAARKTLELAEEAARTADHKFKHLSQRAYGVQLHFESAFLMLEREAHDVAPDFVRTAWEDMVYLEGMVSARFLVDFGTEYSSWHDRLVPTTQSNHEAVLLCQKNIKIAKDRFSAMIFEDTQREKAQAEIATIFADVVKEAYALGVSKSAFEDRRKPVDQVAKEEDRRAREQKARALQREARRSQMTTIRV